MAQRGCPYINGRFAPCKICHYIYQWKALVELSKSLAGTERISPLGGKL